MKTRILYSYSLCILVCLTVGFIIGRQYTKPEHSTRYIKGETIERLVEIHVPYKVETPSQPIYLYKRADTIFNTILAEIDTVAILNDWISKKSYTQDLFDNQYGKLTIDASVQYNQLGALKYNFTPLHKEISVIKRQTWMPYLSISYNTLNHVGLGGGIFYHNIGIGAKYITDFNKKGFDFELKYKF